MVPAMTCNNLEEQLVSRVGGGPFPLERYYEKQYSRMFGNIWHDSVLFLESIKSSQPISVACSKFLQCETIRPPTTFCDIQLWSECYLRWILPANLKNALAPSEEQALDEKMMELARRMKSSEWKRHVELPEEYSSAYPYSIPEISRPIIDLNDSDLLERPDGLDNISIKSSFTTLSFTQTTLFQLSVKAVFDQEQLAINDIVGPVDLRHHDHPNNSSEKYLVWARESPLVGKFRRASTILEVFSLGDKVPVVPESEQRSGRGTPFRSGSSSSDTSFNDTLSERSFGSRNSRSTHTSLKSSRFIGPTSSGTSVRSSCRYGQQKK
uniref:p-granule-associated protein DEPS-1 sixth OB-fold domain-containing protein n=1 Tax=Caenorhabditis japonica TaxID=281687 RepID=A0A8R1DZ68_CAEJA